MAVSSDAKSRAKDIFRKYDDGTGLISLDVLSTIMEKSIPNISRQDVVEICKCAGIHGDQVGYEAFLDAALAEDPLDSTALRPPAAGCGHVFVLHCNAEGLAADAVLALTEVRSGSATVRQRGAAGKSTVYEAIQDGDSSITGSACCVRVVQAFLDVAGPSVSGQKSPFNRSKPLLAMGLPGIGAMDPSDAVRHEGEVIGGILPIAYAAVERFGVDLAICVCDENAFKVLQLSRKRYCPFRGGPFWMLDDALRAEAGRLKASAERGRLSLFFGAGVSFPSGLPSWGGLLDELADRAQLDDASKQQVKNMSFLDQPTIFEQHMGSAFKEAVAEITGAGRYTPAHAMLRGMGIPAVTTNYDHLYESAAQSAGQEVARLPWDASKLVGGSLQGSVLKLHGCTSRPQSIVLTRSDYMRYEDKRRALRGSVQHLLMTTEMLFVGFSMTDDNLHLIIDQVREVLYENGQPQARMGTVLSLIETSLFRQLWERDFHCVAFGHSWDDAPAWRLDCFLDLLAASLVESRARASFLLNPKYAGSLDPSERQLAETLRPLAGLRGTSVEGTAAWSTIREMLRGLGLPDAT